MVALNATEVHVRVHVYLHVITWYMYVYLGILSFAIYLRDDAIESLKMANRPSYVIYRSGVIVYVHILRERERERERRGGTGKENAKLGTCTCMKDVKKINLYRHL